MSAADDKAGPPLEDEPTRKGQIWTATAAAVLGLIALMGVFLVITGGSDDDTKAPAPAAVEARDPAPANDGTCPASKTVTTEPASAPQSKWKLVGTVAAPQDDENGPTKVDGQGYRLCFAHSPTGALYAAVNFLAIGTSDLRGAAAVKRYVADTPEREDLLASPELNDRLDASGTFQVRAYRFELVKPDRLVVNLALGVIGAPNFVQVVAPMRWEAGDWKLVAPADGDITGDTLTDLAGYTEWSGA